MFTYLDIKRIKEELEQDNMIACSDEFMERIKLEEDRRNDDVAKAMRPHRTNYNNAVGNIPDGYDNEGQSTNGSFT